MSSITTHVLDTARGRPGAGVPVTLEVAAAGGWILVGKGETNADGRISNLVPDPTAMKAGVYRLIFDTARYFSGHNVQGFYPQVTVVFNIENADQHYHVPLLLSPFGYSTYRGS
ncbi:MAG: hydroxyisourate hydrolase [Pyrinomonadaceae bacterium]